jgi:hypothetical protein
MQLASLDHATMHSNTKTREGDVCKQKGTVHDSLLCSSLMCASARSQFVCLYGVPLCKNPLIKREQGSNQTQKRRPKHCRVFAPWKSAFTVVMDIDLSLLCLSISGFNGRAMVVVAF